MISIESLMMSEVCFRFVPAQQVLRSCPVCLGGAFNYDTNYQRIPRRRLYKLVCKYRKPSPYLINDIFVTEIFRWEPVGALLTTLLSQGIMGSRVYAVNIPISFL
jgi:hypothetical protein